MIRGHSTALVVTPWYAAALAMTRGHSTAFVVTPLVFGCARHGTFLLGGARHDTLLLGRARNDTLLLGCARLDTLLLDRACNDTLLLGGACNDILVLAMTHWPTDRTISIATLAKHGRPVEAADWTLPQRGGTVE